MEGHWIIQSTIYSLNQNFANHYTHATIFKHIDNIKANINKLESALKKVHANYHYTSFQTALLRGTYCNIYKKFYNFFVYLPEKKEGKIFQITLDGKLVAQYIFKIYSSKNIFIEYRSKSLRTSESIYFINKNLKIIKSVISVNNRPANTYFSSAIKIS